jgi:predicted amidohydrolase
MQTLTVAVLQTALVWQDSAANRAQFEELFAQVRPADLIVLPEMFNSGFSMQANVFAESMSGATMQWLKQQAARLDVAICGSLAIRLDAQSDGYSGIVNRFVFVQPSGEVDYYDKRHLFRMGQEHRHYQAGLARKIVQFRGVRWLLQVCYDLRFPVFSRNRGDYDAILYVANWPQERSRIWSTLLAARAIENQAFVVGCNRVGQDGNQLSYSGDSVILDFVGLPLASTEPGTTEVLKAQLDLLQLQQFRQQFPAALDADAFELVE